MPVFFECHDCGFASDKIRMLLRKIPEKRLVCPICEGDNGSHGNMVYRDATQDEIESFRVA